MSSKTAKAVKDAATSATNTIRDFVDPPPENPKTDFLAVGVGVLVAGLLTWGIYKAFKYFNTDTLEDNIKANKAKMAKTKSSLLDEIKQNRKKMNKDSS